MSYVTKDLCGCAAPTYLKSKIYLCQEVLHFLDCLHVMIASEYGSLLWIGSPYGSPSADFITTQDPKFFPFLFVMYLSNVLGQDEN